MGFDKKNMLFICVHNSARSQIAEEYLRLIGGAFFDVESAGLEPSSLNPFVVEVLQEDGINIANKKTHSVWDLYRSNKHYDYVITVCDRSVEDKCPLFPGPTIKFNWSYPDPEKFVGQETEIRQKVRELRNVMKEHIRQFVKAYAEKK